MMLIAVTGTPGSGKSSFAKSLGRSLDAQVIEINDIVKKYRLYSKKDKFGTMVVDLGRLDRKVSEVVKKRGSDALILVGHLAPELRTRYTIGIVTRCNLKTLVGRLEKRRYPNEMMVENIASEATDYCGTRMSGRCKELYEVETDTEKKRLIHYIANVKKGKKAKRPRFRSIDELHGLAGLIKSGNKYGL